MFLSNSNKVYIDLAKVDVRGSIDVAWLKGQYQHSQFSDCILEQENLEKIVDLVNEQAADNVNENEEVTSNPVKSNYKYLHIATCVPAQIKVEIDSSEMSAKAIVTTAFGGEKLTKVKIKQACMDAGIRFGLKASLLTSLIDKIKAAPPGEQVEDVIVQGRQVSKGNDAYIEPKIALFAENIRKHRRMKDGRFDMRDFGEIQTVEIGQVVAEKIPATKGIDGINVLGIKIEASPGQDIKLTATEGTEINPNNTEQLIANREGLLRRENGTMVVDEVFVVDQVDAKTGHIKFNGGVIVKGDVTPDMKIEATGDVTIGGFVESATIKSQGSITIAGGCSGRILNEEELQADYAKARLADYSCQLHSANSIHISFANQTQIVAKTDLHVEKNLTHCKVAASDVLVGNIDKPMGKIIGSYFYLNNSLRAGTVGTESDVHVDINLNRRYVLYDIKLQESGALIQKIKAKENSINQMLESDLADHDKKVLLTKKRLAVQTQLKKYQLQRNQILRARNEHLTKVYVQVNQKVFTHVKVQVGRYKVINSEVKGPSLIKLVDGQIELEPSV